MDYAADRVKQVVLWMDTLKPSPDACEFLYHQLSIGLSADSCCLWHDESPVSATSATPVIRATAGTLSLVFILDGIIFQSWLLRDARSPHQENNGKERYEGSCM